MNLEPIHYRKAISKVWRRARIARQVKREFVAWSLGVSKSTVDKVEQGAHHVRLYDVIRFCQIIDFCPVEFIQQVMKETPPPPQKVSSGRWLVMKEWRLAKRHAHPAVPVT